MHVDRSFASTSVFESWLKPCALWQVIQFFLFCHFPGKTLPHATKGVEWVGPDSLWTTAQFSSVADGINRVLGPRMQRAHGAPDPDAALGCTFESLYPAWRQHKWPQGIIRVQKWTFFAVPSLSKAKQVAKERPLKAQLVHTDVFIERSRLRIQEDQEQEAETGTCARADRRRSKCCCTSSSIRFG